PGRHSWRLWRHQMPVALAYADRWFGTVTAPAGAAPRPVCGQLRAHRRTRLAVVAHAFGEPHGNLLVVPRRPEVALSFDDGPTPRYTPTVLRTLARFHAHATFFVTGRQAKRYRALLRAEARAGHEIGNHTFDHPLLVRPDTGTLALSRRAIRDELASTDRTIRRAGLPSPRLFRPPYGVGLFSPALTALVAAEGERVVGWDIAPDAYLPISVGVAVQQVVRQLRPGAILLIHDGRHGRERDVQLLRPLLRVLARRCYRAVTVSRLLADSAPGRPPA
ncbi:MAG: polysaccharide deacetylase family protein, partial [Actinomycetota bacterium]|nr:polysaccharide deacetylase family protein [Actinomycetota bacterium]